MGFFSNLGNWIWDGVILNLIFGAGALTALVLGWGALYLVLAYVAQNDVYRGLMSSDEDNPLGVVMLCLLTPPMAIGVLGLAGGLLISTLNVVVMFFLNLIPFALWGENDASLLIDSLIFVIEVPIILYGGFAYFAMAKPLLSGPLSLVFIVVAFGYLFPSGENRGSLGDTNRQYAALSIAMFLSLFSVILMMSFSSVAAWMYEYEVDLYDPYSLNSFDEEYNPEGEWMPNYTYQSSEGGEILGNYLLLEHGRTGLLDITEGPGSIECLSLNSLADEADAFHYGPLPAAEMDYHVRLVSPRNLSIHALTGHHRDQDLQTAHYATTGLEFHTREIANHPTDSEQDLGFSLSLFLEDNETFASAKYHVVYVHAPNGINSSTTAALDDFVANLDHPQDCGVISLLGALEPRVRASSWFYGFGGMFLFGCVFHRYYVITGRDGTTDPAVLFRTFWQSQLFSVVLYAFLLFAFDPLDGTGVTGLRKEWIAEVTIFAGKVGILLVLLALVGILGASLYRQRGNIGDAMTAMIKHDRELTQIERGWFDSGRQ